MTLTLWAASETPWHRHQCCGTQIHIVFLFVGESDMKIIFKNLPFIFISIVGVIFDKHLQMNLIGWYSIRSLA